MQMLISLVAVLVVVAIGLLLGQVEALRGVLGVAIPYLGGAIFLVGVCWRVFSWAGVPVPFRIPTTC